MDLGRVVQMVLNMILRKAVNRGIKGAVGLAARKGKAPSEMTPQDQAQAASTKALARRAQQAARMARRIGR